MRKITIACIIILLTGCMQYATVSELRQSYSKREMHNLNRELSLVLNDVRRKSMECLQFSYVHVFRSGVNVSQNLTFYNVKAKMVGANKAEMTVQMDNKPRDAPGSGGMYVFLADMEKTAGDRVRMTLYGPSLSSWDPIFAAVKGWGEGKNIKCPETP